MMKNNWSLRSVLAWLALGLFAYGFFNVNRNSGQEYVNIKFSDFIEDVNMKRIKDVTIFQANYTALAVYNNNERVVTQFPYQDQLFIRRLLDNQIGVRVVYPDDRTYSFWMAMITSWLPNILLFGLILYSHIAGQGGRGAFGFGKSKAKLAGDKNKRVTFKDVAGLPEAKDELLEIVDFLKSPDKFIKVGAKIPKGVLLYGPPGTGKTLLARAIAGEARVPFLYISGAEFVEMFVGVGASRVRDMFAQAKKIGRCIVFIDELDSIGKKRSMMSMNDERETTLNQFLVELDGFDVNTGIIVIGATNRPDVLDPALLRPGRLDRLISVPLPDARGREEILKVHLAKVKVDPENGVNLKQVIQASTGMSGAQLASIVNESAIIAGREGRSFITTKDLVKSMEEAILGSKSSIIMQEKEREITAYHEAGHAIISLFTENSDPIFKATIIPTGKALGMVVSLPEYDEISVSKAKLLDKICMLMGGRIGEELQFGPENVTSGAVQDIERATSIATNMVTKWGMSDVIGKIHYNVEEQMAGGYTKPSEEALRKIHDEISRIVTEQYNRGLNIIQENRDKWELLARALLELETLTGEQVKHLITYGNLDEYTQLEAEKDNPHIYRSEADAGTSANLVSDNGETKQFAVEEDDI